jgi:hypothetical protein
MLAPQSFKSKTNIKDEIKRMNFGIDSAYNFGGHKFFIEARFTRGFINIQTHPDQGGKKQNRLFDFAAGYICSIQ